MRNDTAMRAMLGVSTAILVLAAVEVASGILAPVVFALFAIALVWPFQQALAARVGQLPALLVTLVLTVLVVGTLGSMAVWGISRVGQWLIRNAAQLQALYAQTAGWLEGHGLYAAGMLAERFNVSWLIRGFQEITLRLQSSISFLFVTLIFVILGLLEAGAAGRRLARLGEGGEAVRLAAVESAAKLRRYMLVRSLASVLTGVGVWAFASLAGLELALEWGVIAFALNYIPFIGPLVATVLPTLFAMAQFASWQMAVLVFVCLQLIQFMIGSYMEPRLAGRALSLSPFMVLFAVFFWALLWGIAGAFIGVPIMIAAVTLCAQFPASRWVSMLLSGDNAEAGAAKASTPGAPSVTDAS
jgi:predicted PurR-regulated permease PerM